MGTYMIAATLASLAMLPACTTMRDMVEDPTVVQASASGVTYRYSEGLLPDARRMAKNHCQTNDGKAKLDRVEPGEGNNRTAMFLCV